MSLKRIIVSGYWSFLLSVILVCLGLGKATGQTILEPGDIAIVGVNTNNNACSGTSGAGQDYLTLVTFKEIVTGTTIIFTDNGWERTTPNRWGDSEGVYQFEYNSPASIQVGQTFNIRFGGDLSETQIANSPGPLNPNGWLVSDLNISVTFPASLNMNNGGDQLFVMQGGTWDNQGATGDHDATYSGTLLFGFNTLNNWNADGSTQQSNLPPSLACFHMNPTSSTNWSSYTGPMNAVSQLEWLNRISNPGNWSSYTNCGDFLNAINPPMFFQLDQNIVTIDCSTCSGCGSINETLTFGLPASGGPFTLIYTDGTSNFTINNAIDGTTTNVTVSTTTTFEIVSVTDGSSCPIQSNLGAPVTVTVGGGPTANSAGPLQACDNGSGTATFDLTSLNNTVNGGTGLTVNWAQNSNGSNPIANPNNYSSGSSTVYAQVIDGACTSNWVAVSLQVSPAPTATSAGPLQGCDSGVGTATFNLTTLNSTINGGTGFTVNWAVNSNGSSPILNPSSFTSNSITVYAQVDNGTCTSNWIPIVLQVNPTPSAIISVNPTSACPGDAITFSITGTPGASVTYNDGSGTTTITLNTAGNNPSPITATMPNNDLTYTITQVSLGICTNNNPNSSAIVTLQSTPTASISVNPTSACPGDAVTFSITGTPGASVTYNDGSGTTTITLNAAGNNPSPITATMPNNDLTYIITQVTLGACTNNSPNSFATVTLQSTPTASISVNPTSACPGDAVTFSITGTPGASVTYNDGSGTTTITLNAAGNNPSPITATMPNNDLTYIITQVTLGACTNNNPNSFATVTLQSTPAASISVSPTSACPGDAVTFSISGTPGAAVTYNDGSGTTTITLNTAGNNPSPITATMPNNDLTYIITQVTLGACTNNNPNSFATVTVQSTPTASISVNPTSACPGDALTFSITGTPGASVTYNDGSGTTTITLNAAGNNPSPITATMPNNDLTYIITQVTLGACTNNNSNSFATVTVQSTPTASISANTASACPGETITFSITGTPGAAVTYNDGSIVTTITLDASGNNPFPITVTMPNTNLAYTITQVVLGNCTNNNPNAFAIIAVDSGPSATIANGGDVCFGQCTWFEITPSSGTPPFIADLTFDHPNGSVNSYSFNVPIPSANAEVIMVCADNNNGAIPNYQSASNTLYIPEIAGNAMVTLDNISDNSSCPGLIGNPDQVSINVIATPSATIVANPSSACSGQNVTFTFSGTPNASVEYFNGSTNQTVDLGSTGSIDSIITLGNNDTTWQILSVNINNCVFTPTNESATVSTSGGDAAASLSLSAPLCVGSCVDLEFNTTGSNPDFMLELTNPLFGSFTLNNVPINGTWTICAQGNSPPIDFSTNTVNLPAATTASTTLTLTSIVDNVSCPGTVDPTPLAISVNPADNASDPNFSYCPTSASNYDLTQHNSTVGTGTISWYDGNPNAGGTLISPDNNVDLNSISDLWVQNDSGSGCPGAVQVSLTAETQVEPTFNIPNTIYCEGDMMLPLPTVSNEGISGSWSPALDNTSTTNYTFTPSAGCADTTSVEITIRPTPSAPATTSPVTYCENDPASPLSATGNNLIWYTQATGGVGSITGPTPSTSSAGTNSYWVSQTVSGCESQRAEIQVVTEPLPSINFSNINCNSATTYTIDITISGVPGANYTLSGTAISGGNPTSANEGISFTITLDNSTADYTLTVEDNGNNACLSTTTITTPNCVCPTANISTTTFEFCGDDSAMDLSVGGSTGLTITDNTNLDTNDNDSDGVEWFIDNPPLTPYTTGDLSPSTSCSDTSQQVYAYLRCDPAGDGFSNTNDDSYALIGSITISVYPDLSGLGATILNNGSCNPTIDSWGCSGAFTISNDYDSNGANPDLSSETGSGTITFTVTNPSLPATLSNSSCGSYSFTMDYFCVDCPSTNDAPTSELICTNTPANLPAINLINDNGNAVRWFEDISDPTSPTQEYLTGTNVPYPASGNGCSPADLTLHAYILCDDDGDINTPEVWVDLMTSHTLTIYPVDITSFIDSLGSGTCTTSIAVDNACGNLVTVSPSLSQTAAPGINGIHTYTISYDDGGLGCIADFDITVNYDCPSNCPSSVTAAVDQNNICGGNSIALSASASGGTATVSYSWTGDNGLGSIADPTNVLLDNLDCAPLTYTFTLTATCDENGSLIGTDQVTVTVFPNDISSFIVQSGAGTCNTSVSIDPTCGSALTVAGPNSQTAAPGTSGNHTYNLSYDYGNSGLNCIPDLTISIPYSCGCSDPAIINSFTLSETNICFGDSIDVEAVISGGATTGTWSTSPVAAGTFDDPNALTTTFSPQINGSITLTFTSNDPDGAGTDCVAASESATLTVLQLGTANDPNISLCSVDAASYDLTQLNATVGIGTITWYDGEPNNGGVLIANPSNIDLNTIGDLWAQNDQINTCPATVNITLNISSTPQAPATMPISYCQDETAAPLTASGSGLLWYTTATGGTGSMNAPTPNTTATGTTSFWVSQTVNGCESARSELMVTVESTPVANPATANTCDEGGGMASFDLTSLEPAINGATNNSVLWFENMDGSGVINNTADFPSGTTTVYATVNLGNCFSDTVPVILTVDTIPFAQSMNFESCDNGNGEATFNLDALAVEINGGNTNAVNWYTDAGATILITGALTTASTTVYAIVTDGNCSSPITPVDLNVSNQVSASPTTFEACDDGNGTAYFDLSLIESTVNNGTANPVNWFEDAAATISLTSPVIAGNVTIYAIVGNGNCQSNPVAVDLVVRLFPDAAPVSQQACGDANDMATFDLQALESSINLSTGYTVNFFEDISLSIPYTSDTIFTTTATLYAQVDNGQCLSLPVAVILNVLEQPDAFPAAASICDEGNGTATFDLTTLESTINGGTANAVNFFEDSNTTVPINGPFNSASTTVYAVVGSGNCVSQAVAIQLTVDSAPTANSTTLQACDEGNGTATFDLTTLESTINGGTANTVNFFEDSNATIPITGPFNSASTTIYAVVGSGNCVSQPVAIQMTVDNAPAANAASIQACDEGNGNATFDLTTLESTINGGTANAVNFFEDSNATVPINGPFNSASTTIYAVVGSGNCVSQPVAIQLTVDNAPAANAASIQACDEGNGNATFDLTTLESTINAGTANAVNFFEDSNATIPINGPFNSASTTIYAVVGSGNCVSQPVAIQLTVDNAPTANNASIQACDEGNGNATFDLTTLENTINGGTANAVNFFEDSNATVPINGPFNSASTTIYAVVGSGNCVSQAVPIQLMVNDTPTANTASIQACDEGNGNATFNLTTLENTINGGTANAVNFFEDSNATIPISGPFNSANTTVFAQAENITGCTSQIVPVNLSVVESVTENLNLDFCDGESILVNGTMYDINNPSGTEIINGGSTGGCDSIINVSLNYYEVITGSIEGPASICSGSSASLTFSLTGADSFTVIISDGINPDLQFDNIVDGQSIELMPMQTTEYTLIDVIGNNTPCPPTIATNSVTIEVVEIESSIAQLIDYEGFGVSCNGSEDGSLEALPLSGTAPYTYLWSNGASEAILTDLSAGTYTVTITDAEGCTTESDITLQGPEAITASLSSLSPDCYGEDNGILIIDTITGNAGPFEYSLDGTFFNVVSTFPVSIANLSAGTYDLTIQDLNDCNITESVNIAAPTEPQVDLGADISINLGDSIQLNTLTNFEVAFINWGQSPVNCSNCLDPFVYPLQTTAYNVTVTDSLGCSASDDIIVTVEKDREVFIPTAFTPNNDGQNDVFYIQTDQSVSLIKQFYIFNRWGEQVFGLNDFLPNNPNMGWDGRLNDKELNPGVFVYLVEIEFVDGRVELYEGDITLIK